MSAQHESDQQSRWECNGSHTNVASSTGSSCPQGPDSSTLASPSAGSSTNLARHTFSSDRNPSTQSPRIHQTSIIKFPKSIRRGENYPDETTNGAAHRGEPTTKAGGDSLRSSTGRRRRRRRSGTRSPRESRPRKTRFLRIPFLFQPRNRAKLKTLTSWKLGIDRDVKKIRQNKSRTELNWKTDTNG